VVGGVDERTVLIADGDTRKLEKPKKKKLMHLRAEPGMVKDALSPDARRAPTADSAIRKALKALSPAQPQSPGQADRKTDKEEYAFVQE
jgi:ribosomal protein L14E/L6E/L27E